MIFGSRNGCGIFEDENMKSVPPSRRDTVLPGQNCPIALGRLTFCRVFLGFLLKPDLARGACTLRVGAVMSHA